MSDTDRLDSWTSGNSYDRYMGRWSRRLARPFLDWVGAGEGLDWVDVGCGTGALSAEVAQSRAPASLRGVDMSDAFVAQASKAVPEGQFVVADATALPFDDATADICASSLVLNFVPDKTAALSEMRRVLCSGGRLAFAVWDYPGGGMGFIDAFWKAARRVDDQAADMDESARFPFCTWYGLAEICHAAGLEPEITQIDAPTVFKDFDDLWEPFTLGSGPAPGFLQSLDPGRQSALRAELQAQVQDTGGPIKLPGRAWAVKARV